MRPCTDRDHHPRAEWPRDDGGTMRRVNQCHQVPATIGAGQLLDRTE